MTITKQEHMKIERDIALDGVAYKSPTLSIDYFTYAKGQGITECAVNIKDGENETLLFVSMDCPKEISDSIPLLLERALEAIGGKITK